MAAVLAHEAGLVDDPAGECRASDLARQRPTPVAAPTSRDALAAARRRLRRSMLGTFWIPAAMTAIIMLIYVLNSGRL
jgi:hypothetical protein